jgi:hypothetical protein
VNIQIAHAAHVGVAVVGGAQGGSAAGSDASSGQSGSNSPLLAGGGDASGQAGRSPREQSDGGAATGRASPDAGDVEGVAGVEEPDWQTAGGYSAGAGLNGGSWLNVIV